MMRLLKVICLATLMIFVCGDLSAQDEKGKRKGRRGQQQRGNILQLIQRLDANRDNALTADEIPDRLAERLARMDLDENGTIDAREIKQIAERLQKMQGRGDRMDDLKGEGKGKGKRRNSPDGDAMGKGKGKAKTKRKGKDVASDRDAMTDRPSEKQFVAGLIRRLDKNGDQIISKDEAPERMQRTWERIDQNANKVLDEDELVALAKMMQRRGDDGKARGKQKRRDNEETRSRGGVKPKRPGSDG